MCVCVYAWIEGYKGNIVLIVQEVHDSYWTVADPGAEQHEEADLRLHPTALYTETKTHNYKGLNHTLILPYTFILRYAHLQHLRNEQIS